MNTKYTSEECLQAYYDSLEEQLAERDAMIDWLVDKLISNVGLVPVEDWRKAAHNAVRKDD